MRQDTDIVLGIIGTLFAVLFLFGAFWLGQMNRDMNIKHECDAFGQTQLGGRSGAPTVLYVCRAKV